MLGLLVHLQGISFFFFPLKRLRDTCEDFVIMDIEIKKSYHHKQARLLLWFSRSKSSNQLRVVDKDFVFLPTMVESLYLGMLTFPWSLKHISSFKQSLLGRTN